MEHKMAIVNAVQLRNLATDIVPRLGLVVADPGVRRDAACAVRDVHRAAVSIANLTRSVHVAWVGSSHTRAFAAVL